MKADFFREGVVITIGGVAECGSDLYISKGAAPSFDSVEP